MKNFLAAVGKIRSWSGNRTIKQENSYAALSHVFQLILYNNPVPSNMMFMFLSDLEQENATQSSELIQNTQAVNLLNVCSCFLYSSDLLP